MRIAIEKLRLGYDRFDTPVQRKLRSMARTRMQACFSTAGDPEAVAGTGMD